MKTKDIDDIVLYKNPDTGKFGFYIITQVSKNGTFPIMIKEAEQDANLLWLLKRAGASFIIQKDECTATIRIRRKSHFGTHAERRILNNEQVNVITPLDIRSTEHDGIIRYLIRFRDGKLGIACESELKELPSRERPKERD